VTGFELLSLEEHEPGVGLLTLRRAERLNALSWALVDELHEALAQVSASELRVLVLTGDGPGFCSGLDIADDASVTGPGSVQANFGRQEHIARLALALRDLPQPVIGAVNGAAAGGGLALALACDVRVCAPSAKFNVAFVRIGLSGCDVGVSFLLPRIVGAGIAAELMLTGRMVDADEALRIGLANRVTAHDELLAACYELARDITRNSPFGVRMTKQVLRRNLEAGSLESAIELENRTQTLASLTGDLREALSAFRERRPPSYTDS
jgi:enoyl-CoA hydratase